MVVLIRFFPKNRNPEIPVWFLIAKNSRKLFGESVHVPMSDAMNRRVQIIIIKGESLKVGFLDDDEQRIIVWNETILKNIHFLLKISKNLLFIISIIQLKMLDQVTVYLIIAILGSFLIALWIFFIQWWLGKPNAKKLNDIGQKVDTLLQGPTPIYIFTDGLRNLPDIHKRQIFEQATKLSEENKYDEAIEQFRILLSQNPTDEQKSALLSHIGNTFYLKGDYDESLGAHRESLRTAERAGVLIARSVALGNLGLIYNNKGEPDTALKYHEDALKIHREIGYRLGEANDLGNIGVIYNNKGELDTALKYHEGALKIHREIGSRLGEASDLGNIGVIYKDKGELDTALKYHEGSLKIDREIGNRLGEASDLGNIGVIYKSKGEPNNALKYFEEALIIFKKIGAANLVIKTMKNIEKIKNGK
jgi:tetratricopeptide (TPR) repeat protein